MASLDRNKWLLLASSLGVLVLLVAAAVRENVLLEWRQVQAEVRLDGQPVPVHLRQVVNPTLGVADRCVSCHVSMAPGEQSVTGPAQRTHPNVVHDPADFGCTACHGGQGRATLKEDAHGTVHFWPEPMLPVRSTEAGCGTCHATAGIPRREILEAWSATFERLDCRACHRVDGRGGTIRPDGGGMEGPDLTRVGLTGYRVDWHDAHVTRAAAADTAAPWLTSWRAVSETDRAEVERFLATRVAMPSVVAAKSTFFASGCLGCHKVSGVGGDDGPDLTRAGEKDPGRADFAAVAGDRTLDNWFDQHARTPASVVVGSQMPALRLTDREVDDLTLFTLSLRRRDVPGSYLPRDRMRVSRFAEREFASDGATVFGAFCAGCHGRDGLGLRAAGVATFPSVANPDFLAVAPDALLSETIRRGRPGRRMRAWSDDTGVRAADIPAIVAYLRAAAGTPAPIDSKPARWVQGDPAEGGRLFERTCAGCHGPKGEGLDAPALNNPVLLAAATDTFFVETIARGRRGTGMVGFAESSPIHPTLTRADIESIVSFIRTWGVQP